MAASIEVTAEQGAANRLVRRKARTRQALINAARHILASGRSTDLSVQEITDAADVGLGSFYNHFTSKAELFEAAVDDVLEQHGQYLDALLESVKDPADVFATSIRLTARMADTHPDVARILVRSGASYLHSDRGLAPRALRDIELATGTGRFSVTNPYVALASTAGSLLAYLHLRLERPDVVGEEGADELAEQILRMLGMTRKSAHVIAHRPLPDPGIAPA